MNFIPKRHIRKKGFIGLLLFIAASAWAWLIWLVIVLVVVFAAVIVSKLVQLIRRVNNQPPPQEPGNVTRVFMDDGSGNLTLAYETPGAFTLATPNGSAKQSGGFTLHYGIGDLVDGFIAWVAPDADYTYCMIGPVSGDKDHYFFNVVANGQKVKIDYTSTNGYTSQVLDEDTFSFPLVIERSTDLLNWEPVFTNENFQRYTIENWTDTNAPAQQGFYRTRQ